jgi:SAM-dependent methyltransferase
MPGSAPVAITGGSAATATAAAVSTSASAGASARKGGGRPQPRRRQWWETLFSDEYLRTVVRPTSQQIARQVDFMQASLGVSKGAAVLDVGCGLGQHALEFARRGCLVVALDLALPMITRAAEDAQQEGLRINFLHKDIRDIGFEGTFDAVTCVGTTFGFFDDEQNREVLGRLANALKPGGRLLLEVVNRDHVLSSQPNLQWFEGDGCVVMEESDFNYYSSRLTVKRTMMREDGRQTESEYSIRLYALHELGQMMQAAGFRVKEVSGGQAMRGVFFGAQSSRIILLAERRTPAAARGNGHTSDAPPAES